MPSATNNKRKASISLKVEKKAKLARIDEEDERTEEVRQIEEHQRQEPEGESASSGSEDEEGYDFNIDSDDLEEDADNSSKDNSQELQEGEPDSQQEHDDDDLSDLKPKNAQKKKKEPTTATGLFSTINKLLTRPLAAKDTSKPILSLQKHLLQDIDQQKLEAKARRQITAEKKQQLDKDHIILKDAVANGTENWDYEKNLKRIGTRGVVKLFNAIKVAQKGAEHAKKESITRTEKVAEVSKDKFLSLIKGTQASNSQTTSNKETSKASASTSEPKPEDSQWKVFKESFGMSAGFKDWDKLSDDE